MAHRLDMHRNNTIDNAVVTGVLIGVVMLIVWGTTFVAQAVTGRTVIQQRHEFGLVAAQSPRNQCALRK